MVIWMFIYLVNIFLGYSILGFLFENTLNIFFNSHFESGILHGPWTFIYGFAILIIMAINKLLINIKLSKTVEISLFFSIITITMTALEYLGGNLIESFFHVVYWDYSSMKYNYGKYIALPVSITWGLLATIINYTFMCKLNNLLSKIPVWLTLSLLVTFVSDLLITILF